MKQKFLNWLKGRKAKAIKQRNAQLTSDYNIEEKHGDIYIIAGQHAIRKIDSEMTALQIVDALNQVREDQIDYYRK